MKRHRSTSIVPALAMLSMLSACLDADPLPEAGKHELTPQIQEKLDALLVCQASEDDCAQEHEALLEHASEIDEALLDLDVDEFEDSFRATAIAECTWGNDVSCSGYSCLATDDVGCSCTNTLGHLVDVAACADPPGPICGNGICEFGEFLSCLGDCGCTPPVCGPADCGSISNGCGQTWCGSCSCEWGECANSGTYTGNCCSSALQCPGGWCEPY